MLTPIRLENMEAADEAASKPNLGFKLFSVIANSAATVLFVVPSELPIVLRKGEHFVGAV